MVTKCPSKFQVAPPRPGSGVAAPAHLKQENRLTGDRRPRTPDRRVRRRAVRHRRLALRRVRRRARMGRLRPSRRLRAGGRAHVRLRDHGGGVPRSDFSFNVVATHSSTTTPAFYKATAAWSSQEGSLLLWVWLLSIWSSLALALTRRRVREVAPVATAVLMTFAGFFLTLTIFFANPFDTLAAAAERGDRPEPAAAPPGDDVPPPDAVLGVHALLDPVRVRDRRAGDAPAERRVDRLDAPLRAGRVAVPRRSGSCSARAGPTPSSAGAATGPGTRSRTRRCCRG